MSLLRAGGSLVTIAVPSSSKLCLYASRSSAALHTSAARFAESQKQRVARIVRKTNIEKKAERARYHEENKPHVVLGTRPGEEETKWRKCDLAKILVTPEELSSLPPTPLTISGTEVEAPKYASYGLDGLDDAKWHDEQLDFLREFPAAIARAAVEVDEGTMERIGAGRGESSQLSEEEEKNMKILQKREADKAQLLTRVVDLRNANARGIAFENRRRIISAFSPTGKTVDSGYPEVQVALLTMKIRNVWDHLMRCKKDIPSRRALRLLVHQRAKMLKYIKRVDRDRYDTILERVGLSPESVEGELVV